MLVRLNLFDMAYYISHPSHLYPKVNTDEVDVIICGMKRSGSTLVYNLSREILDLNHQKYAGCRNEKHYRKTLNSGARVLKIHANSPLIRRRIKQKKTIGIFTYRNLYDVAASLHQLKAMSYEKIEREDILTKMGLNSIVIASTPGMHLIKYEDHVKNLHELINKLAKILNRKVSEEKMAHMLEKYSMSAIKKSTYRKELVEGETNPPDSYTGFNNQHVADGESNKFSNFFSETQMKEIKRQCREFMKYFGYEG